MSAQSLVLASSSPYRRAQLSQLGVPFGAQSPDVDEDAFKTLSADPSTTALTLAAHKARDVARRYPESHVLGADQLVDLSGEILGKPESPEAAVAQLMRLEGRAHRLLTAIALVGPGGGAHTHLEVHTLHMRGLSRSEIERYVTRDEPLDCAGSYKIECAGIALFERIEGHDFTAIVGLPLLALTSMLRAAGFAIP
jgi:septum formation protein